MFDDNKIERFNVKKFFTTEWTAVYSHYILKIHDSGYNSFVEIMSLFAMH